MHKKEALCTAKLVPASPINNDVKGGILSFLKDMAGTNDVGIYRCHANIIGDKLSFALPKKLEHL